MLGVLISKSQLCVEITCCKMLCQIFFIYFFFKSTYPSKADWYDTSKPTKTFFKITVFQKYFNLDFVEAIPSLEYWYCFMSIELTCD